MPTSMCFHQVRQPFRKNSSYNPVPFKKKYGIETAAYISNELDLSEKWKVVLWTTGNLIQRDRARKFFIHMTLMEISPAK